MPVHPTRLLVYLLVSSSIWHISHIDESASANGRYCHNDHIRQFRQGPHKHPHPPGGFIPEEDPRYEAYTLGRARPEKSPNSKRKNLPDSKSPSHSNGGTSIDRLNKDNAVSYGLQPSSRYLVQRWQDGTTCELNGKPREIEVQIHCSMTTTDSIYLIKETSICNYVMIIHSPHLCGLPGFRADHSDVEMAKVRCREVISDSDFEKWISGEEVVMPFLTIGKGLGDVEVIDGGDKSGLGEVRHEGLSEGSEGRFGGMAMGTSGGNGLYEELQMEDGVPTIGLKDALSQLLEGGAVGGDEGEVMLITLEEGDEQVILQTDIIGGEGDAGGNRIDKETILKLVKEYLRKKDKPKRDEDGDKAERDEL
jgi:protein OS-9